METSMRLPILATLFIAATLFGENRAASAQSYAWCAKYDMDGKGTPSCYFATREQCMETISGIGGLCVENLDYHGAVVPPSRRVHVAKMRKRTSNHSHATALR
jgi:hypothetical protein